MTAPLLRIAMRAADRVRHLVWRVTRAEPVGVHCVPLTPAGKVVLVQLTYADGWWLPGGGAKRAEPGEQAMRRELREEIGLLSLSTIEQFGDELGGPPAGRGRNLLFVAHDVTYRPRRSLEIAGVGEFAMAALPDDLSRPAGAMLRRFHEHISGGLSGRR